MHEYELYNAVKFIEERYSQINGLYYVFNIFIRSRSLRLHFIKAIQKLMRFRLHDYHKDTFVVGNAHVRRCIFIIDMHKRFRFSWMLLMFDYMDET